MASFRNSAVLIAVLLGCASHANSQEQLACVAVTDQTRFLRLHTPLTFLAVTVKDTTGHEVEVILPNKSGVFWRLIAQLAGIEGRESSSHAPHALSRDDKMKLSAEIIHTSRNVTTLNLAQPSQSCIDGGVVRVSDGETLETRRQTASELLGRLGAHGSARGRDIWIESTIAQELSCADLASLLSCNMLLTVDDYSGKLILSHPTKAPAVPP